MHIACKNEDDSMKGKTYETETFTYKYQKCKGVEFLPQTLIFYSLYLFNPMSQTLDISNY